MATGAMRGRRTGLRRAGLRRTGFAALAGVGSLAGLSSLVAGCGSAARAYDVNVSLDPALVAARGGAMSAEVDLVGVPAGDVPRWESYNLGSYFGGDDPLRGGAVRHAMAFTPGGPVMQTLPRTDPIWSQWKQAGATDIVVLAQWPGGASRRVVPLDPAAWEGSRIGVVVKQAGLEIQGRKPDAVKP